jgi:glutamate dehydrogenase/leucine dehydrogenase
VLCNAGGVTASYFEWAQNCEGLTLTRAERDARLRHVMRRAFNEVWWRATEQAIDTRDAAYALAISRVASAMRLRDRYR